MYGLQNNIYLVHAPADDAVLTAIDVSDFWVFKRDYESHGQSTALPYGTAASIVPGTSAIRMIRVVLRKLYNCCNKIKVLILIVAIGVV